MKEILVGRQPIYDTQLNVQAYELLFRGADLDCADPRDGDRATGRVLMHSLTEIGLDRLVGGRRAFINLTRSFLVGKYPMPAPPGRVVLEVLENVGVDDEIVEGIRQLKEEGFTVALDDFEFIPGCEPLLHLADLVKLDVVGLEDEEIARRFEQLRPFRIRALAEKVETKEQFEFCRELGFELFQGYFLARPDVVRERSVEPNQVVLLQLLADIQRPNFTFEAAEEIVGRDVALTYRLLRHINSAAYGLSRKLESIRETLVYLGLNNVRSMATLFLLASVDDKPHDLVLTAMFRAKMCQLIGELRGQGDQHQYFTVGLLSILDALMDAPMSELVDELPLSDEIRKALTGFDGELGYVLNTTIAYERGDWVRVESSDLSIAQMRDAFLKSLDWVGTMDAELSGQAA